MKLRQLRVLDTVARHLNITSAAHELEMSQPAVSLQIKLLEDEFGKSFFIRTNRGLSITAEGRRFIDLVRPALIEINQLQTLFDLNDAMPSSKSLIIGGSHTLSVTALPDAIAEFQIAFPGISVELHTDNSHVIENGILAGTVDIGLITALGNHRECTYEAFQTHEAVAFVVPDHPLAGRTLTLAELSRHPLVSRKDSTSIKDIRARGYGLDLVLQCDAPESVKAAVKRKIGIGILFRSRVENELRDKELTQIFVPEFKEIVARSYIVYSARKPLADNAQRFLTTLRALRSGAASAVA